MGRDPAGRSQVTRLYPLTTHRTRGPVAISATSRKYRKGERCRKMHCHVRIDPSPRNTAKRSSVGTNGRRRRTPAATLNAFPKVTTISSETVHGREEVLSGIRDGHYVAHAVPNLPRPLPNAGFRFRKIIANTCITRISRTASAGERGMKEKGKSCRPAITRERSSKNLP